MGGVRRTACPLAWVAVVACASPTRSTAPQHMTTDPCLGRPTANVRARLAEGRLVSALRVSEWACVDDETRHELAETRAWLAESADPDAALAEAQTTHARGDTVLARRLFDRAAIGMQRAGSPPRWELPGPLDPAGDAIFLGSTRVASVAGTRVVLTEVATGARRLLWPRADAPIRGLTASDDGRFLAAETSDEVLVWEGPAFAGRVSVMNARVRFAPNGRTLVLAHRDGLTLWDATTRQTISEILGNSSVPFFVGDRLVDPSGNVVELATGAVVAKLPPIHFSDYWAMAVSPDGRVLLRSWLVETESLNLRHPRRFGVEVWDTSKWRKLGAFETGGMGFNVQPVFSRDGTRIFAPASMWLGVFDIQRRKLEIAWPSSELRPWLRVSDARALGEPIGLDDLVKSIELTPDERRLVGCDILGCEIVDWRTGRHAWARGYAQVLPDGSVISRNDERPGSFNLLDANFESHRLDLGPSDVEVVPATAAEWQRSHKPLVPLEPCGRYSDLGMSADGTMVLKADEPGRPCIWKRDDGHLLPGSPGITDFAPVASLDFSETRLLLSGDAGWVRVLDLETGALLPAREADVSRLRAYGRLRTRVSTDAWPKGTASLNADLLDVNDGLLVREPAVGAFVVDASTGVKRWALDAEKRARGSPVALAPGWIALATGTSVDVWDAASHERRQHLDCGSVVDGIAFDVSATQVAARCDDGIFVWERATGTLTRKLRLPNSRERLGTFALGGNWVVAAVGNELVAWDSGDHREPSWRWPSSGGWATGLATDGHVVAVAHGPGAVSLYSLADRRERLTVQLWNPSAPEAVLEAPDGAVWDAHGGLMSMSRCVHGDQEVPTELCESLWVQDDLWRRQMK